MLGRDQRVVAGEGHRQLVTTFQFRYGRAFGVENIKRHRYRYVDDQRRLRPAQALFLDGAQYVESGRFG